MRKEFKLNTIPARCGVERSPFRDFRDSSGCCLTITTNFIERFGSGYLDLLRFFLNHRTLMRSRCPERVGKSSTELMTEAKHPHWLELLGFERFQRT